MDMEVSLELYGEEREEKILGWIMEFFRAHHSEPGLEEARDDLREWTKSGHEMYVILIGGEPAGFLHMCMRGPKVCWIEDIFVEERLRGRGIAGRAIGLAEEMLRERGVEGVCMDVVPDNIAAMRLYKRLGYDRLSLITLRKEMEPYPVLRRETIAGLEFNVKKF